MSIAPNRPLIEITEYALRLLVQELGIVNTARFLNQFHTGIGDSVAEKERLFGAMTVDDIVTALQDVTRPPAT